MAEIKFLPVCSNCGKIIYQKIDYQHPDLFRHEFTPAHCPHCWAMIESIMMPTRLPFDVSCYDPAYQELSRSDN